MSVKAAIVVGTTAIEIVEGDLLVQPVEGIIVSANTKLRAGSGWALEIKRRAGSPYDLECRDLVESVGSSGFSLGSSVVTGGYGIAQGNLRRRVIQAITIAYHGSSIVPATPQIVYRAVRASLEKAELFRLSSVATYLMAIRPTYGTEAPGVMTDALCRALLDHAAITSSISRIVIAEQNSATDHVDRVKTAVNALQSAYGSRYPTL